jgi:probable rRNA maturation factor
MSTRSPPAIEVIIEDPRWRAEPDALALMKRAGKLALARGAKAPPARPALTLLLTDAARLRALNAQFRGQDKPTNVLSFPAADETGYLGDVAIAFDVVRAEAEAQRKDFAAHGAHLCAHGVLHLLAYDHENEEQAVVMESLETAILAALGLPDPYAWTGRAA